MSHIRNSVRRRSTFSGCLTSGILSADVPPSLDVSYPEFCPPTSHLLRMSHIRNSVQPDVSPSPDISHSAPDAGWGRRAIQLPRSDMSGSSDSAYPESIRSRQFRFPGQLGSSDTRDSPDPFSPTIKKQTRIILTTKSPKLSLSLCFILICFFYE